MVKIADAERVAEVLSKYPPPEAKIEFELDGTQADNLTQLRTVTDAIRLVFAEGYDISIKVRNL